jgi:Carboxypeptidase regulatory-like domain
MRRQTWTIRAYRAAMAALTAYFALVACTTDIGDDYNYEDRPVDYAPVVQMVAPESGAQFTVGESIRLEGTADDDKDGTLQGEALVWRSDKVEEDLGTGSPLVVSNLPIGRHLITLTAIDSKGQSTTSTGHYITVLPEEYGGTNGVPSVTVTSPGRFTHYALGETVILEGTAVDPEDGPLSGNSLVWVVDGPTSPDVGTGNHVELRDLPVGSWEVRLIARDRFGAAAGSSYRYITVGAVESGDACPAQVTPAPIVVTSGATGNARVHFDLEWPQPPTSIDIEDGVDAVSDVFASVTAYPDEYRQGNYVEYTAQLLLLPGQSVELTIRAYIYFEDQPLICTMPLNVTTYAPNANTAPQATINSPQSGMGVYQGMDVTFNGVGTDVEDGTLTGPSLVWESNIDGQIGTGATFSRNDLSVGNHTITLRVTDSQGATATATVQLSVIAQSAVASIAGTVKFSGDPVAGVTVTISGPSSATTVTNGQGYYYFPNLAAGTYTVTISGLPQGMTFATTSQTVTLGMYDNATVSFTN